MPEPNEPGVYLVNAASSDCRYPINDPPAGQMTLLRVCGDPATKGAYCSRCFKRIYTGEV